MSTRGHARVKSRRRFPAVCGASEAAVTRTWPPVPLLFQDGKEGVDGSSPTEGSKVLQIGEFCCRYRHCGDLPVKEGVAERRAA